MSPLPPFLRAFALALAAMWGAVGLVSAGALVDAPSAQAAMERVAVVLETRSGRHRIRAELAMTPEQRSRGLMFRTRLGRREGMLFLYEPAQPVTMWMKNTYIPLDMVFIGPEGRVRRIARDTEPFSEALIRSGGPVRAVLELAAGVADEIGLAVGDRVSWPRPRR